jgi:hypothetical protein
MMKTADFGNLHDRAHFRPLDGPPIRRILLERKVSSRPVIVQEVAGQDAAEVSLAEDEHVIQALAPDRTDELLREGVLPRAGGRGQDFPDTHTLHALPERGTVDVIAIAKEVGWPGVLREGVHDLLGGPAGRGVLGHVEVDDAPAMVSEHDEDEEYSQARGGDREEIEGDQVRDVIDEERAPGLGSATSMPSLRSSRVSRVTLTCSAGESRRGKSQPPRAWMAGQRETDALEPIDEALGRRVGSRRWRTRRSRPR